jgi:hypothetical protein
MINLIVINPVPYVDNVDKSVNNYKSRLFKILKLLVILFKLFFKNY